MTNYEHDTEPEYPDEVIERLHQEHRIRRSIEQIALARSRAKKIEYCSMHLKEFYGDYWDLSFISRVLAGEKIARPQMCDNLGVRIRVNEIRENEQVSFEEAVERFALKAKVSVSAVKKAITLANKGL